MRLLRALYALRLRVVCLWLVLRWPSWWLFSLYLNLKEEDADERGRPKPSIQAPNWRQS